MKIEPLKILVCDDRSPDHIQKAIESGAPNATKVEAKDSGGLTALVKGFFGSSSEGTGIRGFLASPLSKRDPKVLKSDFDGQAIVILDNELAEIDVGDVPLTAEAIAGFVRAFSDAPYVISLNKNPLIDFDLKYLVGDYETKADLSLNLDHLSIAGLWNGQTSNKDGVFCPWYWPTLRDVADRRGEQIKFVIDNLDRPVVGALGFPSRASDLLSSRAVGFLSPAATRSGRVAEEGSKPLRKITFWDHFKKSNRSLTMDYRAMIVVPGEIDPQERAQKFRDMPRSPKDPTTREIIARVVAAEIDFWIRRDVLGPQDILSDVPHLQMKLRMGLKGTAEAWNRTVDSDAAPFGLNRTLYDEVVSNHRFGSDFWVPRPAFWWPSIESDRELPKTRLKLETVDDVVVFCEDTRRFVRRTPEGREARSFLPEGGKPWRPFFVERPMITYSPQSQFAA